MIDSEKPWNVHLRGPDGKLITPPKTAPLPEKSNVERIAAEVMKLPAKTVSELHQKDKVTIVPYVENASVLSKLWQSGVHYIQGYYLQGPSDAMNYDFDMES